MTQVQLMTQQISKLETNQMALQAALEEVSLWVCQRGSEDIAGNINGALDTLNQNAKSIAQGIVKLTVNSGIETWRGE